MPLGAASTPEGRRAERLQEVRRRLALEAAAAAGLVLLGGADADALALMGEALTPVGRIAAAHTSKGRTRQ